MPSASDVPPITVIHQETPSPLNSLGVKGLGEGGAIGNALERYGEGVHLVALAVDDLAEAAAEMKANGARVIESGTQVFIHPRDGHGVMYQLIERE